MRVALFIAVIAFSLGGLGCREGDDTDGDTLAVRDSTPTFAPSDTPLAFVRRDTSRRDTPPAPPPTPDGTVLGAFIAASRHEIQHGRLAEQKASTQAVRDLGRTVSRDHDDFVQNAQALGKKLAILPATAPADTSVAGHKDVMSDLRSASGASFDRTFLEHEIDYHRWLVDQVNTTMISRAQNAEVKTFLEQAVPAFQAHMKAAQDLLSKLPK